MRYDKPGCFGFAATYSVKSKVCQGCAFNEDCGKQAKSNLEQLSSHLNVGAVRQMMQVGGRQVAKSSAPKTSSTVLEKILSNMPAHVARAASMMVAAKVNHRASLLNGVNSMKGRKPAAIEVLFDLLLKGSVHRADYQAELKRRLDYTDGTASSQASIGIAAVLGIGIAQEDGSGGIVIRGSK